MYALHDTEFALNERIFSEPMPKAQGSFNVCLQSIRRPSVNFSHFRRILRNCCRDLKKKLDSKQVPKVITQVCSFHANLPRAGSKVGTLGP